MSIDRNLTPNAENEQEVFCKRCNAAETYINFLESQIATLKAELATHKAKETK
jgi:hypothetical protein